MAGELDPNQITQQMLNPQSQGGDSNDPIQMLVSLLSTLGSAMGPSSAEAASQPDPNAMALKLLQQRNQQAQREQQNQMAQQRMQQQQQQFDTRRQDTQAAAAAKAKPAPQSIADILAGKQRGSAPSGGGGSTTMFLPGGNFISSSDGNSTPWQPAEDFNYNPYATGPMNKKIPGANPNDLMFRGKTPGTGTPYFGNVAPDWAPEEVKQQFNTRKAEIDIANKPKQEAPAAAGAVNLEAIQKHAEVVKSLTKDGYSPTQAVEQANLLVPEVADMIDSRKAKKDQAKNKITLERQQTMADYNAKIREKEALNKPLSPSEQKNLGYNENLQRNMDVLSGFIKEGSHKDLVGPIRGTEAAYKANSVVGNLLPGEVTFRQAAGRIRNALLRNESGAAINEAEAKRLAMLVPDESMQPDDFVEGWESFQKELTKSMQSGKLFMAMTRGDVRQQAAQGVAPAATQPAAAAPTANNSLTPKAGSKSAGGITYRIK